MTYFYHAVVDSAHLPRDLDSDSAQSAIITVISGLWPIRAGVPVPSSALVEILDKIGISEVATRGALSRMQRKGTLQLHRDGRRTSYQLSPDVAESIPASEVLTLGFGETHSEWTGDWTVVVYSIPETQRDRRHALREWLRWLGFGPVRDGVWISPRSELALTRKALDNLLPHDAIIFRSSEFVGTIDSESVWPLAQIQRAYDEFIEDYTPSIFDLRAGTISPLDALRLWIGVQGRWRAFPTIDPNLPRAALPGDWPQKEARRVFRTVHDESGLLAHSLVASIVAKYDTSLAEQARAWSVDDALLTYREMVSERTPDEGFAQIDTGLLPTA